LFKWSFDHVDNPYFSAMQIKVKRLGTSEEAPIKDTDSGKVILIATLTLDEKMQRETEAQLKDLTRVAEKYANDLAVYSQFTFDVCGGESMTNRQIALWLRDKNLLTPTLLPSQIRFLEKVSAQ
jgi:hypothetical protein